MPSLRHPMVNASATATLADLAPGRVAIALRHRFQWPPRDGEVVEWEGAQMQMLHPDGHAPARPVGVPILIAALGPKGHRVGKEWGDGLYVTLQLLELITEYSWVPYLVWGTGPDASEAVDSEHARRSAGPGWALAYDSAYEFGGPPAVRELPGGAEWMEVVERSAPDRRHLAVHTGHCVHLGAADEAAWRAGGRAMLKDVTTSGTRDEIRRRLDDVAAQGVTEVVFQPCGPAAHVTPGQSKHRRVFTRRSWRGRAQALPAIQPVGQR